MTTDTHQLNKYPHLVGRWQSRVYDDGWYIYRFKDGPEDEIIGLLMAKMGGTNREPVADLFCSGWCKRVSSLHDMKSLRVVPIDIVKATS